MTASVAAAPDEALRRARDFVENTDVSIFLTGKAGTGKTTFLRDVVRTTAKSCIVVAPTGVAAINAGGVTIHSFFQLATAPFVPGMHTEDRRFSFAKSKLRLIRSLDLLIIDEISMVRADLLDAVDDALRRYRRDSRPFGGVQLLMIGDLHQLAPVVTPADAAVLNGRYDTPYFFSSHALERISYMTVSLEKVFRQQDESFVTLLNHVRDNAMTLADVATLNSRLNPTFVPADGQGFIRLTTHNHTADAYNERRMASLATPPRTFVAAVKGVFPEGSYPTAAELTLKVGAQVMFNKNDTQGGEYYNGLIGTVESFTDDGVMVRSAEDGRLIRVAPQVWENARYTVNEEKGTVETEVQGTFTQVPLRPAWAITIHKSQGLTFERVVIDAGSSFAPGQVYVALSRCRTLEGIVLATPISPSSLYADPAVNTFMDTTTASAAMVMEQLPAMKAAYHRRLLSGLFNFGPVLETLESLQRLMYTNFRSLFPEVCMHVDRAAADATKDLVNTAAKWRTLIEGNADMSDAVFNTRVRRSALFFRSVLVSLFADLVKELGTEKTDNKKAAARRAELTEDLRRSLYVASDCLQHVADYGFTVNGYLAERQKAFIKATQDPAEIARKEARAKRAAAKEARARDRAARKSEGAAKEKKGKAQVGETYQVTLRMARAGMSRREIAEARGLTPGTINTHLQRHILSGALALEDFVAPELIDRIEKKMLEFPATTDWETRRKSLPDVDAYDISLVFRTRVLKTPSKK